MSILSRGTLQ
jgi:uncharacterized protein